MKIYNRDDFMNLPVGTFYYKADEPWTFQGSLLIKETTIYNEDGLAIDWVYIGIGLDSINHEGTDYDKMLKTGISIGSATFTCRDGSFADGDIFLVFEKEDLLLLRELVDTAIAVCDGDTWFNDDDEY